MKNEQSNTNWTKILYNWLMRNKDSISFLQRGLDNTNELGASNYLDSSPVNNANVADANADFPRIASKLSTNIRKLCATLLITCMVAFVFVVMYGVVLDTYNKQIQYQFQQCEELGTELGMTQRLIKQGADYLARDKNGRCVTHKAAYHANVEKLLFYAGLNSNLLHCRDDNGNEPIHAGYGSLSIITQLIKLNVSVFVVNDKGNTIAHLAALRSTHSFFGQLVESLSPKYSAIFNIPNDDGRTPLHLRLHVYYDINNGTLHTLLTNQGTKLDARDILGNNLFLSAVDGNKSLSVLETLIHFGISYSATNYDFCNALHIAATQNASVDVVKYLLDIGVDPRLLNKNKKLPINISQDFKNEKIAALLTI